MKHAIEHLQEEYINAKSYAEGSWGKKNSEEYRPKAIDLADALTALGVPTKHPLHLHQVRVIEEKKELDEKATKLSEFIGTSPGFEGLDHAEQERLKVQNDLMWQYSEVLGQRIAAF